MKYKHNENYFNKIDSPDKAYFLGLLYADGNLYYNKKQYRTRVQIFLQNQDKYVLEKFLKYLNSNSILYSDRGRGYKLIIDNRNIYKDLLNLGLHPNKTFSIEFPNESIVPNNLISHFIRGYFDGDGCVSVSEAGHLYVDFTSNEKFLNKLSNVLQKLNIECSKYRKRYKNKLISSGSISINRRKSQKLLHEFLYKDCSDIFMSRKKEKFDKINNQVIKRKSRYE